MEGVRWLMEVYRTVVVVETVLDPLGLEEGEGDLPTRTKVCQR